VCSTDYTTSPPELTVFRVGPWFEAGDSVVVYADNNPDITRDDEWLHRSVQAVDTSAHCGMSQAQDMAIPYLATTGDTVRVGAPVRAFNEFTYGLYQIGGEWYLGRRARGTFNPNPLVGPLLESQGVAFRYLDSMGAVTTVDTLVSQIELTLRYRATVRDARGNLVSDSLVTRIHPRN
jgi:hypothetical protein